MTLPIWWISNQFIASASIMFQFLEMGTSGSIWLSGSVHCYHLKGRSFHRVSTLNFFCHSLLPILVKKSSTDLLTEGKGLIANEFNLTLSNCFVSNPIKNWSTRFPSKYLLRLNSLVRWQFGNTRYALSSSQRVFNFVKYSMTLWFPWFTRVISLFQFMYFKLHWFVNTNFLDQTMILQQSFYRL